MFLLYIFACASNTTLKIDIPQDPDTGSSFLDVDGDGYIALEFGGNDCNDENPQIHVNAEEVCDQQDNNCDGNVDEGLLNTYYIDQDNDGFGIDNETTEACNSVDGYVSLGGDCDDTDIGVYPNAIEVCDGRDNNCDNDIDEGLLFEIFIDEDNDGFGSSDNTQFACEEINGFVTNDDDCDDGSSSIGPAAEETCDYIDNDCDGEIDESGAVGEETWYLDMDGDGYGSEDIFEMSCAPISGYTLLSGDCNDFDSFTNPSALDECDSFDNNCDGIVDNGQDPLFIWFRDDDGDGYGDVNDFQYSCNQPVFYISDSSDCNDNNYYINPDSLEYCNEIDDNCDGNIDEEAVDREVFYIDFDGDGFGHFIDSTLSCSVPEGYVSNNSDCSDVNPNTFPGAAELDSETLCMQDNDQDGFGDRFEIQGGPPSDIEIGYDCDDSSHLVHPLQDEYCNGIDDNCDGNTDGMDSIDPITWYYDADNDGFGNTSNTTLSCYEPSNFVYNDDDCNDNDIFISPQGIEICDGQDNNCDDQIDEIGSIDGDIYYADTDNDGFGNINDTIRSCTYEQGYVQNDIDCNDNDINISPDSSEKCDGIDNNCDDQIDEIGSVDGTNYFTDGDEDGFGNPEFFVLACHNVEGTVTNADDCDDNDPNTFPGSAELDSTTLCMTDADGDGFGSDDPISNDISDGTDCGDDDPDVYEGALERCNDQDDDCNGIKDTPIHSGMPIWYKDQDDDGFGGLVDFEYKCTAPKNYVEIFGDCNDNDDEVHPDGIELCDSIDNNCDNQIDEIGAVDGDVYYFDEDGDEFGDPDQSILSCTTQENYVLNNEDCDDTSNSISPDTDELCNAIDDNCNDLVDEAGSADGTEFYIDNDEDGFGDPSSLTYLCSPQEGFVVNNSDCNDQNSDFYPGSAELESTTACRLDEDDDGYGNQFPNNSEFFTYSGYDCDDTKSVVNPDQDEFCNEIDDNCDGMIDSGNVADGTTVYADGDLDGYGDPNNSVILCNITDEYVENNNDCDDTDAFTFVGAAYNESSTLCTTDEDGDGYGDKNPTSSQAQSGTDCNDNDIEVHPNGDEYCNEIDDNCDGHIDGTDSVDSDTWYYDLDGDGYGDNLTAIQACLPPEGFVALGDDCDDSETTGLQQSPNLEEICEDDIDNDCNGTIDDIEVCEVQVATISTNQTNLNLSTIFNTTSPIQVYELYIESNVTISSLVTSTPAINTDNLPSGSTLYIFNEGIIHGRGGDGSCATYGDGGDGGDAIEVTVNTIIDNTNGFIFGGGGGGGSGDDSDEPHQGKAGGGGGSGFGQGCDGGGNGGLGVGGNGSARNGNMAIGGDGNNYSGGAGIGGAPGYPAQGGTGGSGGQGGYGTASHGKGQGGAGGGWGGGGGGGSFYNTNRNPGYGGDAGYAVRVLSGSLTWDGGYNNTRVKGLAQ